MAKKITAAQKKKAAEAKEKEARKKKALKAKEAKQRDAVNAKKKAAAQKMADQKKRIKALDSKKDLNTGDLVEKLSLENGITRTEAKKIVNGFLGTIQSHVTKGHSVHLTGFGVFERVKRKGRTGRNPQTGEKVKIPAKRLPNFRPGKPFKALVEPKVFG